MRPTHYYFVVVASMLCLTLSCPGVRAQAPVIESQQPLQFAAETCEQQGSNHTEQPQLRLVASLYGENDPSHDTYFFVNALKLALEKTRCEYGDFEIVAAPKVLADDRLKAALVQSQVDVLWHTSVTGLDKSLQLVPISPLGSLGEYRLLLIRDGDQSKFKQITELAGLQRLVAGIGAQWPGVAVLELNQLPYVTSSRYELLFRMLAAKRFDYFPRGVYQVQSEVEQYGDLELVIAPGLMLKYPSHVYYYVRKDDHKTAERIAKGLSRAWADGSIDALIESVPKLRWARQELAKGERRVLELAIPSQ